MACCACSQHMTCRHSSPRFLPDFRTDNSAAAHFVPCIQLVHTHRHMVPHAELRKATLSFARRIFCTQSRACFCTSASGCIISRIASSFPLKSAHTELQSALQVCQAHVTQSTVNPVHVGGHRPEMRKVLTEEFEVLRFHMGVTQYNAAAP